ncbi:MAG: SCO family protein [Phycisphaeraceae bacterium]|nr:SCO family protein [Phycisphaeraceae bacterium]
MHGRWIPRLIVIVVAAACVAATVLLTKVAAQRHVEQKLAASQTDGFPEVMFDLPDFTLTNQLGEPFGSIDLRGHLWIAQFFYSRCTTICPMVTGQMARVKQFLDDQQLDDVRMVSITVDPEHDNVDKLVEYAHRMNAQLPQWAMLTGDKPAIWGLVENGFHLAVSESDDPNNPIAHSASLVLVDGEGRVRRCYHEMNVTAQAQRNFELLANDLAALRGKEQP